jgi:hypothetical protein
MPLYEAVQYTESSQRPPQPRPHPRQAACSRAQRLTEAADRAKQNRSGAPQATSPSAVVAPPPRTTTQTPGFTPPPPPAGMAAAAADAAASATLIAAAAKEVQPGDTRRAGQWPPQVPPKADCLLTDAERRADRAKQNRPGAPQATAPVAGPAPPPPRRRDLATRN